MGDMAGADGAIACWNDKYNYEVLAADHGDPLGGTDGNPDDRGRPDVDAAVQQRRAAHHPGVPRAPVGSRVRQRRGHRDAEGLLRHRRDLVQRLQLAVGNTREFDRFSHAIKEIVDARVWAGIHFRTADTQGHAIGRKVAHWLDRHYFEPVA